MVGIRLISWVPDAGKRGSTSSLGSWAQLPRPWESIATEFIIGPRVGKLSLITKKPKTRAHFTNCQRPQTHAPGLSSARGRWSSSPYWAVLLVISVTSPPRSLLPTRGFTTSSARIAPMMKV